MKAEILYSTRWISLNHGWGCKLKGKVTVIACFLFSCTYKSTTLITASQKKTERGKNLRSKGGRNHILVRSLSLFLPFLKDVVQWFSRSRRKSHSLLFLLISRRQCQETPSLPVTKSYRERPTMALKKAKKNSLNLCLLIFSPPGGFDGYAWQAVTNF